MNKAAVIESERRLALPAAIAAVAGVVLVVASLILIARSVNADGEAELLREVEESSGPYILGYVLRSLGIALLAIPLFYLFRAALSRAPQMRGQLVGVVIAGPLFLAGATIASGLAVQDAAGVFADAGFMETGDALDDQAQELREKASLAGLAVGLGIGGGIGFAVGMTYTCLWAMRVGLLTRFWGSLGMALGAVSLIFFQFTMLWFVYLGLLIAGWMPKRPEAWDAGEAVPWPTPGDEIAEQLEGEEAAAEEPETPWGDDDSERPNPPRQRGERRKRKSRD